MFVSFLYDFSLKLQPQLLFLLQIGWKESVFKSWHIYPLAIRLDFD